MYKLIIVDDETSIRLGMANSMPWNEWGFEIVGTASDGLEALALIADDKPDVVLSDIRMPNMDGIKLMQYLNSRYPEIKIIILSGYSDFEYLNISIKNKVVEYLLKPTDLDEFESVFRRMKTTLDEEHKREHEYRQSMGYRLDIILSELTLGGAAADIDLPNIVSEYGIDTDNCYVVLLYVEWSPKFRDDAQLSRTKHLIADTMNDIPCDFAARFFVGYQEKIIGIVCPKDAGELKEHMHKALATIKERLGTAVYACISSRCTDRRLLPQCRQQVISAVRSHSFCDGSNIAFYTPPKAGTNAAGSISFNSRLIFNSCLTQNKAAAQAELDRVFSELESAGEDAYIHLENMCLELLFRLSGMCMEYNLSLEQVMEDIDYCYDDLRHLVSPSMRRKMLSDITDALSDSFSAMSEQNAQNKSLAQKIHEYVKNEYMCNHMSLEYVASKVNKSAAYVSKVFKDEFGCNFSKYITNKRMEKSIELLNDKNIKIYEIASRMGYADVSNFIKVFKKKYGISPGDYRNLLK